ncbi:MAG: nascent polypeptide-associated complex protein [Candidatus Woesearchaeota archaeon]
MMPGMNSRQMKQAMKRMGMQQEDMPATQVIIRTEDKEYVFDQPQVAKINMMGQQTYQVIGEPQERALETTPEISDEDVETVKEQAGVSEEEARKAIEEADGDLAQAIMDLQSE